MPAIQVARTDTFEQQRQKINQLGTTLFNITAGGSDLSTGNLKLGDGTRIAPSLSFVSDPGLGIYKPDEKTIGYVSDGKKIADFAPGGFYSFRDLILQQKILKTSGLTFNSNGSNYDPGSYSNVAITGGTGDNAEANITVIEYTGNITNDGLNYKNGSYTGIPLSGGNGSGAVVSFTVPQITGDITNPGSGYVPGTYNNVPLTGGSGINAKATVVIGGSTTLSGSITSSGSSYTTGNYVGVSVLNNPTTTYNVTSVSNPGTPPPANIYAINGTNQLTLNLIKGNTYRFNVSDSSNIGHFFLFQSASGQGLSSDYYQVISKGISGSSGAFVDLIIKPNAPTETIKYYCSIHSGMGGNINIVSGASGNYGTGAFANVSVNSSGQVSNFTFSTSGNGYKLNDIVQVYSGDIGGTGSGFEFTLAQPTYTGSISLITVTDNGSGYLQNDLLSFSNSNVGGYGSGAQYTITSKPLKITNLSFISRGSGYLANDVLTLPSPITGITTTLKGQVTDLSTTLSTTTAVITVSSTVGIVAGMNVSFNPQSSVGTLAQGTTVLSVDSLTQLTLSTNPTSNGSATLTFSSIGSLTEISVSSVSGILVGSSVTKTSGSGVLANNTTVASINPSSNIITLSAPPTTAGSATLTFTPPYGSPTQNFSYQINALGVVDTFIISSGGNGYSLSDTLSVNPTDLTQPITYSVYNQAIQQITFTTSVPSSTFSVGNSIKLKDGQILTTSLTSSSTIVGQAGNTYTSVSSTTNGSGTGATFTVNRSSQLGGAVSSVTIVSGGYFYKVGDTITIAGSLVGGTTPTDNIVLTISSVNSSTLGTIRKINTSGSNISSIIVDNLGLVANDVIVKNNTTNQYTINTASPDKDRYLIDTGSGPEYLPNLTLYSGSTYIFDFSDVSNTGHIFSLSKYKDGIWGPSLITGISTTLSSSSSQITVSDTTGILPGMQVIEIGSGAGALVSDTKVLSVDSLTTLTLDKIPLTAGLVTLTFRGVEYTNGISRTTSELSVKVSNDTPDLYYYCALHEDEGGDDNSESLITTSNNNPKTFGSGLLVTVAELDTNDVVKADILTGEITSISIESNSSTFQNSQVTQTLTAPSILGQSIIVSTITSTTGLSITASGTSLNSDLSIGSGISLSQSSGNITTSGVLKTTNSLNINDRINITNNVISSTTGNNILLSPATGRVAKISATSAITIPAGTTAQRPAAGIVENGSIRFNTDTGQYEGYSGATSSWSSLGGVRDLDGNTYIAAEASVGANDNTLYFYNDGNNTVKVTPTRFIFNVVKNIDSPNPLNPPSTEWAANTPVALNSYVYYGLNLYKVTTAGTTGTSGNEPTHTTGTVANGTAQLLWYSDYAGDVTFDKVANINVKTNIVFNDELKLFDNKITTLLSDVIIEPFAGKKVDINTNTSLVLPNGTTAERGIPGQGSVRFNTSLSQFEGYNGTNWTSLGGVRDVDGNTYIIPETSPGANENILYFYNNGSNTLRLSATELTFDTIDQIGSTSNNLDLQAQTVTFNSLALTVDNSGSSTKLLSTKTNIDFALSVGLFTNPLLRLNTTGDILVNKGFGTASDSYIKVLDNELKSFELDDAIVSSSEYILTKGTTNSGASVIFDPTLHSGAKVIVVANNTTTNHKDMIEFAVIAKDTDIFQTEYGNLVSGTDIITPTFDFDAGGKVRLNVSLVSGVTTGNVVNITVVSTIIKK